MTGDRRGKTVALVDQVIEVLQEYRDYLPMTLRQIFYRLVGKYDYPKSENAYKRLCEHIGNARRARHIDFDDIRDDGFQRSEYNHWSDPETVLGTLKDTAGSFVLDRQYAQPIRTIVWTEAGGMVPMIEKVARKYSVPVFSSGGFDSVSAKHNVAGEFLELGAVHVLHIGDHDPSGVHVSLSLEEDVNAFMRGLSGWSDDPAFDCRFDSVLGCEAQFIRLAVIPDQIDQYSLPTAPQKKTDNRNFIGETVQAEALPPDVLSRIVEDAIVERIDDDILQETIQREQEGHEALSAALENASL